MQGGQEGAGEQEDRGYSLGMSHTGASHIPDRETTVWWHLCTVGSIWAEIGERCVGNVLERKDVIIKKNTTGLLGAEDTARMSI